MKSSFPQVFIRVGKDRYAPVYPPYPTSEELYVWDSSIEQIVPAGGALSVSVDKGLPHA